MLIALLDLLQAVPSAQVLCSAFLAILFLQSGIDKVTDWGGNLSWLTSHFANSPLKNNVPMLLGIVTVTEIAAGLLSALGVLGILFMDSTAMALWGAQLSALSLVMLFFGQRMAKDYGGAASLAPYFMICVFAIYLLAGK